MVLGSRMRERRRERGLSQERLANQAGVTLSAIQRLEAGQVSDPHYSTLTGIAHALGTTVAELVGEKELVPLVEAPEETGPTHFTPNLADPGRGLKEIATEILRDAALRLSADLKTNRTYE